MPKPTFLGIVALLLITALTSSPLPAGTDGTDGAGVPQIGPAPAVETSLEPNDLGLPAAPPLVDAVHDASGPEPLLSPEGIVVGSFTDGARGRPAQPLNRIEEAKLALARPAIAAAEAAGTRMVDLGEQPDVAVPTEDLERIKLEQLAAKAPQPMAQRPGASSDRPAPTPESPPSGAGEVTP